MKIKAADLMLWALAFLTIVVCAFFGSGLFYSMLLSMQGKLAPFVLLYSHAFTGFVGFAAGTLAIYFISGLLALKKLQRKNR